MRVIFTEDTSEKVVLDKKDQKILSLLCQNVRLPLKKVAEQTRLSRQSVEYRLRSMEKNNLIIGSRSVIDISKLGFQSFHYFITLLDESSEAVFRKRAISHPLVNALISYTGKYTLELAIMAASAKESQEVFLELAEGVKVSEYTASILLETFKSAVLPTIAHVDIKDKFLRQDPSFNKQFRLKEKEYTPDEKDLLLMTLLAEDARMSLKNLGLALGMSSDGVRYRISKLVESRYILQFRPVINFALMGLKIQSILFKTSSRSKETDKAFKQFVAGRKSVLWATELFGDWDYLVYVTNEDSEHIHEFINAIRSTFTDYINHYEVLFAYKEYKYSFMPKGLLRKV